MAHSHAWQSALERRSLAVRIAVMRIATHLRGGHATWVPPQRVLTALAAGPALLQVSRVFAAGDDVTDVDVPVLEVLPLGRYCADIASDAATLFLAEPVEREEMPGGDDELRLFDELS
jgi:hypothetical protein